MSWQEWEGEKREEGRGSGRAKKGKREHIGGIGWEMDDGKGMDVDRVRREG